MKYNLKKIMTKNIAIVFSILILFVSSSCRNIYNNDKQKDEKSVELYFIENYGNRIMTSDTGLSTEMITLYSNDYNLNLVYVEFFKNDEVVVKTNNITKYNFRNESFFNVGYPTDMQYFSFDKIVVNTDSGNYLVEYNYETMIENDLDSCRHEDIIKCGQYDSYFLNFIIVEDYKIEFDLIIKEDDVEILEIDLVKDLNFVTNIELERVYLNGVLFDKDNKDYIYSNSRLYINVDLSDYTIGNYILKVKYKFNNQVYSIYTSAFSVFLSNYQEIEDNDIYYSKIDYYTKGELLYELQKIS